MMNRLLLLSLGVSLLVGASAAWSAPAASDSTAKPHDALAFTVEDIHGKPVDLEQYKGKVLLIVNVASKCGNTPQYKQLEEMYQKYKDQGFEVLGFPANNFGHQEPGTNAEILQFCTSTYDVKFPMFAKIDVKGPNQAPLYKYLTSLDTHPQPKGDITWNFEKFVVGRDGRVMARFKPGTKPDQPEVVAAIEKALAEK